jgi:hypothetical protein
MKSLSKSRFISGVQCPKKLYYDVHTKVLPKELTDAQTAVLKTGQDVGFYAKDYFPNGKDATPLSHENYSQAITNTKHWIADGVETVYEATFSCNGGFAALDILHHRNNERWAIEVKSSTAVKDYHIDDAAYQYYVMKHAGFTPDRFFILHLNRTYQRNGDIDVKQLFQLEDITSSVLSKQQWVEAKKDELLNMLSADNEPDTAIGKHCDNPFECGYKNHCWQHIPENSVFDLHSPRGKDWQLYEMGVLDIREVPEDFDLTERQKIQIEGLKNNKEQIDLPNIHNFLSSFQAPLHFFDFETISSAIPILNGSTPYSQIPFQYSLHITNEDGHIGKESYKEFLADASDFDSNYKGENDPRLKLVLQIKNDIGEIGSIVAYNATFEITRIKELASAFPEHKDYLESLIPRFVDLLIPFRNSWYYLPQMGKSASIKSVLPAVSDFSYKELTIQNGGVASDTFYSIITGAYEKDVEQARIDLKKYCERDTEGMVVIYRKLRDLILN